MCVGGGAGGGGNEKQWAGRNGVRDRVLEQAICTHTNTHTQPQTTIHHTPIRNSE